MNLLWIASLAAVTAQFAPAPTMQPASPMAMNQQQPTNPPPFNPQQQNMPMQQPMQQPIQQPMNQPPMGQQPMNQQPMSQQPMNQQPMNQQPMGQQPMGQQPMGQQQMGQQPMNQQPMSQPMNQPPMNQQPMPTGQPNGCPQNSTPGPVTGQQAREMDVTLSNLMAAIQLFQDFRKQNKLPDDHPTVQQIYSIFRPVQQAAANMPR